MDIRDFEIIVQFKIRGLTMSTLEQQLGRGARDDDLEAVFMIFVEPKYLIRNQRAAVEKTAQKRALESSSDGSRKRPRLAGSEQIYPMSGTPDNETDTTVDKSGPTNASNQVKSLEDLIQDRRSAYIAFHVSQMKTDGIRRTAHLASDELEPAVHDLVNAEEIGMDCRRVPMNIESKNDKLRE